MKHDNYAVTLERCRTGTAMVVYRNKRRLSSFNVSGKPYMEQQKLQTEMSALLFKISNS